MLDFKTPLEGALWCAEKGLKVFPLRPGKKIPRHTGWQEEATSKESEVKALEAQEPGLNWGVYCGGSGLVCFDVDTKEGKVGAQSLETLEGSYGTLPSTFTVRTASGGRHFYYLGQTPSANGKIGKDIDIKSKGGFVVAPGSVFDGKRYTVEKDVEFVTAPAWIGEALGAKIKADKTESAKLDSRSQTADARNYLKTCEPAVEGHNGDTTTFKVLTHALDLGVSPETCLELAEKHFNPRCSPPWSDEELAKKVENATTYRQNGLGSKSSLMQAEPEISPEKRKNRLPKPLNGRFMLETAPPPRKPFVKGICDEGAAIALFAKSKAKKSFSAAQFGLCSAAGIPFGPWEVKRGVVAIFDSEIRVQILHERIHNMGKALGVTPEMLENLYIYPLRGCELSVDWADDVVQVVKDIGAHFSIFDSMYSWLPHDESAEAQAMLNAFETRVRTQTGCTTLSVRHDPKGDPSGKALVDRGSGHSNCGRHVDAGLTIDVAREETDLDRPKKFVWRWYTRECEGPEATAMLFSGGAFFPGDHEAAVVGQGKGVAPVEAMTKAVLGVLKDEPKVQISKMYSLVQKGCSVGEKVVREHLRNMVDEGVIHRTPICKKPFIEGFTLAGLFD